MRNALAVQTREFANSVRAVERQAVSVGLPVGPLTSVVALGRVEDSGQVNWMASGFLYGLAREEGGERELFLVTNKHVIEGLGQLVVRCEGARGEGPIDMSLSVRPNDDGDLYWVGHPDDDVDIAVTHLDEDALRARAAGISAAFDETAASCSALRQVGFGEGDEVVVLGFPMGLVDEKLHLAIARKGAVARCRDVYEGTSQAYMLDAVVFPGNSGGPVYALLPRFGADDKTLESYYLIGIVTAYLPYHDVAISAQTNRPRVIFEENSGLALAHPVDLVDATIRTYWNVEDAREAEV